MIHSSLQNFGYFLALGSNQGNRHKNFSEGIEQLEKIGILIEKTLFIETLPLPGANKEFENQNFYLNGLLAFQSDLLPEELYKEIVQIEDKLGHCRAQKWMPRHLDIDLVRFFKVTGKIWTEQGFQRGDFCIPHVGLKDRNFLKLLDMQLTEQLGAMAQFQIQKTFH
jgi:2-amino-4-hydroxy-6-hydroxymethyldihydropteridine diphosphokinase